MSEERQREHCLPEIGTSFTINTSLGEKTFVHFQPKKCNLIKLLLDGDERIWMAISDADMKEYDEGYTDDDDIIRLGILRNASVGGLPWGTYVPYKFTISGAVDRIDIFKKAYPSPSIVLNEHDSI